MNTNDLIQAIFAGICFYAGITHLIIGLGSEPRKLVHLIFAVMTLLYSMYSVNLFMLYAAIRAGSVDQFVSADKWGLVAYYLSFATLYFFIAEYTKIRHRLVVLPIVAMYIIIALTNFILPYTWVYTDIELSNTSGPVWTLSFWYKCEGILTALLLIFYSIFCIVQQYRRGERSSAKFLAIAILFFVLTYIWDTFLVEYNLVPLILLLQYGYVFFIVIMSLRLSNQVVKTEKELNEHKDQLEQLVEKRTLDLKASNEQLQQEIVTRKQIEEEKETLIKELQKSLDEIKTLRGILPLCSFCKKIRDDKGYWEQVDVYISKYSEADISHSLCPECMKNHYPEYL